jgi:polyvinyl alcohol dehydrogenase (cytochrome)
MSAISPRPALVAALPLLFTGPIKAEDWPMYLWNTEHYSFNHLESQLNVFNVPRLEQAWFTQLPAYLAAAPTVVDGKLYVGDWEGNFYSIDGNDGHILWKTYVGKAAPPQDPGCFQSIGVTGQAVVQDNVVYVPGGDVQIYALDKDTGNELWRLPIGNPDEGAYLWSSITLFDHSLYVGVSSLGDCPLVRGSLVKIKLDDPQHPLIKYLVPEGEVGGGIWSSVAIHADTRTLYATTGTGEQDLEKGMWGGSLLKMDADTLEIQAHYWLPTNSLAEDIEWGSSPALFTDANGTGLVAATGKDGVLYGLRQDDLSLVWTRQIALGCICPECGCGSLSTPAFDGTRLYVGAGAAPDADLENGSVYAIDPTTGEIIWRQLLEGAVIAPVTVANGVVWVSTLAGLEAYDGESGQRLFQAPDIAILYSQPVVCNGRVYSTFLGGSVIAWKAPELPMPEVEPDSRPKHGAGVRKEMRKWKPVASQGRSASETGGSGGAAVGPRAGRGYPADR